MNNPSTKTSRNPTVRRSRLLPSDIRVNPELPVIEALEHMLDLTELTLQAHYPEICLADWPIESITCPDIPAYTASVLLCLAHALRDASRVHRESIARNLRCPQRRDRSASFDDEDLTF